MAVIIEKAETGAFVTNSSGMGKRNFAPRQRRAPRHGGRKPYAMSMMVKIACVVMRSGTAVQAAWSERCAYAAGHGGDERNAERG